MAADGDCTSHQPVAAVLISKTAAGPAVSHSPVLCGERAIKQGWHLRAAQAQITAGCRVQGAGGCRCHPCMDPAAVKPASLALDSIFSGGFDGGSGFCPAQCRGEANRCPAGAHSWEMASMLGKGQESGTQLSTLGEGGDAACHFQGAHSSHSAPSQRVDLLGVVFKCPFQLEGATLNHNAGSCDLPAPLSPWP